MVVGVAVVSVRTMLFRRGWLVTVRRPVLIINWLRGITPVFVGPPERPRHSEWIGGV